MRTECTVPCGRVSRRADARIGHTSADYNARLRETSSRQPRYSGGNEEHDSGYCAGPTECLPEPDHDWRRRGRDIDAPRRPDRSP
jgi:hypothetical protein